MFRYQSRAVRAASQRVPPTRPLTRRCEQESCQQQPRVRDRRLRHVAGFHGWELRRGLPEAAGAVLFGHMPLCGGRQRAGRQRGSPGGTALIATRRFVRASGSLQARQAAGSRRPRATLTLRASRMACCMLPHIAPRRPARERAQPQMLAAVQEERRPARSSFQRFQRPGDRPSLNHASVWPLTLCAGLVDALRRAGEGFGRRWCAPETSICLCATRRCCLMDRRFAGAGARGATHSKSDRVDAWCSLWAGPGRGG